VILGFALFRISVMGRTGLGDSESYYWTWSQRLDWSYYDHPPVVAWLIRIFTDIGGDTSFMVRMPSVLLFILIGWLLYRLAMDMFDDARVAFYSIITFNLIPVFGIAALQMVPDIPSAACYLAYILVIHRLLTKNGPAWVWYILGGLIGLGMLGKYFAVLLAPSTIILVASVPEYRHWFKKPQPYLMSVTALALFLPVLIWNFDHDWPSFRFHLVERHSGAGFTWQNIGQLVGGQMLYMTPLYLGGLLWGVWAGTKRAFAGDRRYATLAAFSVPTLLFFYVVCAWTNESEPHWPAFGYLSAIVMMIALGIERWDSYNLKRARRLRNGFTLATAMAFCGFAAFYIHLFHPILPIKPKYDLVNELYGWDEVGREIENVYKELSTSQPEPVFALAHHWVLCSQMMFATGGRIKVACINERTDQFDFWDNIGELKGKTAIIITDLRFDEPPDQLYRFEKNIKKIREIPIWRGGKMVRKFTVWTGERFGGLASEPIR